MKWQVQKGKWARTLKGHKTGPLSAEHKLAISKGHLEAPKRFLEDAPLCGCGCGLTVAWSTTNGAWSQFRQGHARALTPVTEKLEPAPLCKCGCGNPTRYAPGRGWGEYVHGHGRRGQKTSEETKKRQSDAAHARRYLAQLPVAQSIYGTAEYKKFRRLFVSGKPCAQCGTEHDICAHHQIPGDNKSLIPLCRSCHMKLHRQEETGLVSTAPASGMYLAPAEPAPDAAPPLCACGCGEEVQWKPWVGWRKFAGRGHYMKAKGKGTTV